jgi:hypothetical protein
MGADHIIFAVAILVRHLRVATFVLACDFMCFATFVLARDFMCFATFVLARDFMCFATFVLARDFMCVATFVLARDFMCVATFVLARDFLCIATFVLTRELLRLAAPFEVPVNPDWRAFFGDVRAALFVLAECLSIAAEAPLGNANVSARINEQSICHF